MVGCSAPNCRNRSEKGIRHFSFPADKDRRQRWLVNCGRDKWIPTSSSRLCEEHFDSSQFESRRMDGWKKLKSTAVPTIFPPLPSKRRFLKREQDMVNCSVRGCCNKLTKGQLRFFHFPKGGRRRKLWRAFTSRDNDLLPKYPIICEVHFDDTQFELKRQDGWPKLKGTAVPSLYPPPSDHQLRNEQERLTDEHLNTALKLSDGEEFDNGTSFTSPEHSADMVATELPSIKQEDEGITSFWRRRPFRVKRVTPVIRDKNVLQTLLGTIADNIQRVSCQLQETTNSKRRLMQLVNALTQEEILLQKQLKKESDKENVLRQQLKEAEDAEKEDLCKVEEMQHDHNGHLEKDDIRKDERCCNEQNTLTDENNRHGLQISAHKENNLSATNILRETPVATQMELKLFEGIVILSSVNNVQFVNLQLLSGGNANKSSECSPGQLLISGGDANKSSECNPGLLTNGSNLTDSSNTTQTDDVTLFAESPAENTDRVEHDGFDQSSNTICNIASVESNPLGDPLVMPQPKHICSFCRERFWDAGARQTHELTHGTEFRCDVCGKVLMCHYTLMNHKRWHSDVKPFACSLCDRRFTTNGTLTRHFRYHTREKHYVCSVCSETFFYAHQRKVHMSVHTGRQPYACQDCGRVFSYSNGLTRHARIHTGAKPYECNVCGKRFRQRCAVNAHKETHGEKPYICSRCGKRLGLGSFWTHMKQHNAKIYYQCAVCDKKLTTKKSLEMHTRTVHMGEAAYFCKICYKQFGKYKDFRLHKEEHNSCSN